MAVENINERGRRPWQRQRTSSIVQAEVQADDATRTALPVAAPGISPSHSIAAESVSESPSRDAEMILAVFRTVVLVAALFGPRLIFSDYSITPELIALAALAGFYNIGVAISCLRPQRFGLRRQFILAMDLALVTAWMQLTGSYQLFSFYYIVVITGAFWFRVFGGAVTAAFCNFFFLFFFVNAVNDRDLVLSSASVGGIALDTGLLFLVGCLVGYMAEAAESERQRRLEDQLLIANYQREIDISTQLQPLLFSTQEGDAPSNGRRLDTLLEAGVANQSARTLGGGDYFDILPLPNGKTALFIADVSGKSVRAQARLPLLKYSLRALAPLYPEPATLLMRLNETLAPDLQPELFVALCCVVLDPQHKTLTWCNAGHIPPLLLPQVPPDAEDDEVAPEPPLLPLETDGPALGMFDSTFYESHTMPWLPGDQLLMFTDGLVDALSYGGSEDGEVQVRHLCTRLTSSRRLGAREEAQNFVDMAVAAFDTAMPLAERLTAQGKATALKSSHRDDVTVALIRYRE